MATNTVRRVVAAGALAAAALTGSALAALGTATTASATGKCLAWYGSRDDGICLGYSNGSPTYIGTPNMGVWGPNGITTGPLVPGTTYTQGINP